MWEPGSGERGSLLDTGSPASKRRAGHHHKPHYREKEMKQTLSLYDFRDAFKRMRPENFSYVGKGKMRKCNLSIGFFGRYKPAHWEGETLEECRDLALREVQDGHLRKKILEVYTSLSTPPFSVSSVSIQSCSPFPYCVSLMKRPHYPFLYEVVKDFPEFPGINYGEQ